MTVGHLRNESLSESVRAALQSESLGDSVSWRVRSKSLQDDLMSTYLHMARAQRRKDGSRVGRKLAMWDFESHAAAGARKQSSKR
ncbi:hypothetical protein KUCAC02_017151 [Chaenocephalus aceratus]|uniref:Uncharacterized protein n=1 Tax=Chaenocephalus aceratus TaxID=36190 RepID=A0ACB9W1F6_CHAAC|nr:hypothetical protein KUCAC02_017151 [Chaenocephalus aceratus]